MTSVDGAEWINWCVNLLYFVQLRAGPGYLIESIPENLYGTIEFYKVSLCKSPVALKSLLVNAYIRRHLWPSFLSTFHPRIDRPQTPRIPGDCQELLQKCHALLEKIPGRWEDVVHKGGENATKGRTTKIRQPTISNQKATNNKHQPTNKPSNHPSPLFGPIGDLGPHDAQLQHIEAKFYLVGGRVRLGQGSLGCSKKWAKHLQNPPKQWCSKGEAQFSEGLRG